MDSGLLDKYCSQSACRNALRNLFNPDSLSCFIWNMLKFNNNFHCITTSIHNNNLHWNGNDWEPSFVFLVFFNLEIDLLNRLTSTSWMTLQMIKFYFIYSCSFTTRSNHRGWVSNCNGVCLLWYIMTVTFTASASVFLCRKCRRRSHHYLGLGFSRFTDVY